MIPNHVPNSLTPDDRVVIPARCLGIHSLVHPASDDPAPIRVAAGGRAPRS